MQVFLYCLRTIYDYKKDLLDYTNLFSPNDLKNNGKIIYKYFKDKYETKENISLDEI